MELEPIQEPGKKRKDKKDRKEKRRLEDVEEVCSLLRYRYGTCSLQLSNDFFFFFSVSIDFN
jgi:hypothetical protein